LLCGDSCNSHSLHQTVALAVPPPELHNDVNLYMLPQPSLGSVFPSSAPVAAPTPLIPSITINFSGSQLPSQQIEPTSPPSISYTPASSSFNQPTLSMPRLSLRPSVPLEDQSCHFSQLLVPSEADTKTLKWAQMAAKYGDTHL
jgi:hypothetical protein